MKALRLMESTKEGHDYIPKEVMKEVLKFNAQTIKNLKTMILKIDKKNESNCWRK